jgi:hypothetical protein
MNSIHQALLTVLANAKLETVTREAVEAAVSRLKQIIPIVDRWQKERIVSLSASQQSHWIGGLNDGLWLTRESDIYDKKTNSGKFSNDPAGGDSTRSYDR